MNTLDHIINESKSLIKLATPMILALTLTCSMSVIDTVMAGQVSAADLAALSLGSSVWNLLFLTMTAILMALTPQVAKFFGERNYQQIKPWISGARYFSLIVTGFFLIAGYLGLKIIGSLDSDAKTLALASDYLIYILIGLPAAGLFQIHKSLSEGSGNTRHILIITTIAVLLNIPLNYLFIHGLTINDHWEVIPAMGGAGCGLASGIIFWISYWGLSYIQRHDRQFIRKLSNYSKDQTSSLTFEWHCPEGFKQMITHLSKVGIPIGLAILAEVSVFTYIPLVIAHLGKIQMASHQIALNLSSLMFMIPLGLSQAITVRTGYQLGRKNLMLAQLASRTGVAIAFIFGLISMTLIMLNKHNIPELYSDNPEVLLLASSLLVLAAIFQLSDTVQVTAAGALRGYQQTTVPMILTIIAFWVIAIPVGYLLGLESELRDQITQWIALPDPIGAKGFWIALISGLSANGVLQMLYLFYVQRYKFNPNKQEQALDTAV